MSIHPDASFPLLASDQAEVIRMFLELMRDRETAGRASEARGDLPQGLRRDSDRS